MYLAYDRFSAQQVAIKVMQRDAAASEEQRQQAQSAFLTEAALAGKLQHPHIATIHDAVSEGDESYIVMEYADGGTLEQYCRFDNLLPVDRLVELMFMACLALDYAQHQGVIHCDIKPANLLLCTDGQLKISDFGAAQYVAAAHTLLSGVGSPLYMSPEQIEDTRLNHQTDIYSLGAVMYQLLTGRPPFQGSSRESLLYQILQIDPPAPSLARPDLPPALDRHRAARAGKEPRAALPGMAGIRGRSREPVRQPQASRRGPVGGRAIQRAVPAAAISRLRGCRDLGDAAHRRAGAGCGEGTTLIREGEVCPGLFHHRYGRRRGQPRRAVAGHACAPGQFFGDVLYFEDSGTPRGTTVTSASPVVLVEIRAEALRRASAACQVQFDRALLRMLVNRVERLPSV